MSNLVKKRLNSFKFLAADSLLERLSYCSPVLYWVPSEICFWSWKNDITISSASAAWVPLYKYILEFQDVEAFLYCI